ncbi:aquaporin-like protein [Russula aff. rugulosa BPL654]|nr:aquaporin-like protein [Russula aff. rugulosa BPL654]
MATRTRHLRNFWPRTSLSHDVKAASFEFVGTTMFLLLAFGGVQAAHDVEGSAIEQTLYIATSFGLSLLVSAWFSSARQAGSSIQNPVPAANINLAQGVFIEMFITAALCLAVLMLAAEKHSSTPFAPIGIGLTLFACHLFAVPYTGAGMNTARAFGPAAIQGFPDDSHWIYWVGPFLGALLATVFYVILKHFQYWTLNPGQEATEPKMSPRDPIRTIRAEGRSIDNSDEV